MCGSLPLEISAQHRKDGNRTYFRPGSWLSTLTLRSSGGNIKGTAAIHINAPEVNSRSLKTHFCFFMIDRGVQEPIDYKSEVL
jgi:hypothetical protein